MNDRIVINFRGGVADVRLNRPEKMNALDPIMMDEIGRVTERLSALRGLRAVVLSGNGRAFCAGLDVASFSDLASGEYDLGGGLMARTHGDANAAQYNIHQWRSLSVPVIAAVHGVAFGAGFQLTLGADIRVVHPLARMSIMEIKWGLIPDMGGVPLMRQFARDDVVRDLTFTGRQFEGTEALALGFATRLSDDPLALALDIAAEIAIKNPEAVQAAKRIYNLVADADQAELLLAESREQEALIGRPNHIEAVAANVERRTPVFVDEDEASTTS